MHKCERCNNYVKSIYPLYKKRNGINYYVGDFCRECIDEQVREAGTIIEEIKWE